MRVLFLADRNFPVEAPKVKTFAIYGDARWESENGDAVKGREIYFSTYRTITRDKRRPAVCKEYSLSTSKSSLVNRRVRPVLATPTDGQTLVFLHDFIGWVQTMQFARLDHWKLRYVYKSGAPPRNEALISATGFFLCAEALRKRLKSDDVGMEPHTNALGEKTVHKPIFRV